MPEESLTDLSHDGRWLDLRLADARAGWAWPRKRPRRRPTGPPVARPQRAVRPPPVWPAAGLVDRPAAGPAVTRRSVRDADTREHRASRVERRLTAGAVIATVAPLWAQRGAPEPGRREHGPVLSARSWQSWLAPRGPQTVSSAPGQPWEHGEAERVSGT
jgi:hypothetical protein